MYRPIETYRGVVYPWSIDQVGHMNVQSYAARFDEASWQFLGKLGLTASFMQRNDRAAVVAEQRVTYLREMRSGALVHIRTELVEIGEKSIRATHRMYDSEDDTEVAVMELVGVYFDTRHRKAVEVPDMVRAHAATLGRLPATSEMPWLVGVGDLP